MKAFIKIKHNRLRWFVMLWDGGDGHVIRWGDSEAYGSCYRI